MGLDMYLSARKYIQQVDYKFENGQHSKEYNPEYKTLESFFPAGASEYSDNSGGYVEITIGYWRKANHIHKWFVDKTQSGEDKCEPSWVTKEQLQDLRVLCQMVLDEPDKAQELLPSESGFFFGSTEYDEWYMESTKHTINVLDNAIQLIDNEPDKWGLDIQYRASW